MRRAVRWVVEVLEGKALLSVVAPAVAGPSPVAVTLATDRATYAPGQPAHFTLTETNTSGQDVTVGAGPDFDLFFVDRDGVEVWRSDQPDPANSPPGTRWATLPLAVLKTLHPGEPNVTQGVWDGTSNVAPITSPTGTFEVRAPVEVNGTYSEVSATFAVGSAPAPAPPVQPAPVPTAPAPPPLTLTVAPGRGSVRPGQAVPLVVTETNTTGHALAVGGIPRSLSASVSRGGRMVWQYTPSRGHPTAASPVILPAGQSRRLTVARPGRTNLTGPRLVPGVYQVTVAIDGLTATGNIQVAR
jgi:hypothetical protein